MNIQSITLDVSKRPSVMQVVRLGQGDASGTTIAATIYDNGTALDLTGLTARFVMRLPDGEHYYRESATVSGSVATVEVDETYAASAVGRTDSAYFELLSGDTIICSTNRFTVVVLRSALDGAEPGENYDSEIEAAIDSALNAATEANSAKDAATSAANTATTAANTATTAAESADTATAAALAAAEEARGAVPSELSLYLTWVEDEDGDNIIALVDASEA